MNIREGMKFIVVDDLIKKFSRTPIVRKSINEYDPYIFYNSTFSRLRKLAISARYFRLIKPKNNTWMRWVFQKLNFS